MLCKFIYSTISRGTANEVVRNSVARQTIAAADYVVSSVLIEFLQVTFNGNWEYRGTGVNLTNHLHIVPRLRMSKAIPPFP
jgi:hypothetical protein